MRTEKADREKNEESTRDGEPNISERASVSLPEEVLSEEMSQVKSRTGEGDWLEADIVAVESLDDTTIGVTVDHPINEDEELTWRFDKPTVWNNESSFVQFIDHLGYDAETIDLLVGEQVHIKPVTSAPGPTDRHYQWTLSMPVPDKTTYRKEIDQYSEFAKSVITNYLRPAVPYMAGVVFLAFVTLVVPAIDNWQILIYWVMRLFLVLFLIVMSYATTIRILPMQR